jgi:UTP--glucose-1-phosphate uridylyltransferase
MFNEITKNRKVKKAVFLIAGLGTRFLPASKVLPKHILPILDKPLIQYWVEEAAAAGIEEIILVTSKGKTSVEDHFDRNLELELALEKKGKLKLLEEVKTIHELVKFTTIRQIELNGDGGGLKLAKSLIKSDEPILMVFPDYLMPFKNNTIQKLVDFYVNTGKAIIAADIVPMEKVSSFGVLDIEKEDDNSIVKINSFVEKPKREHAPSNLINTGIAVLTPEILNEVDDASSTASDNEIRVADAFTHFINKGGELYALKPEEVGYDCGNALGMLKANLYVALERDDLREDVIKHLRDLVDQYEKYEIR